LKLVKAIMLVIGSGIFGALISLLSRDLGMIVVYWGSVLLALLFFAWLTP